MAKFVFIKRETLYAVKTHLELFLKDRLEIYKKFDKSEQEWVNNTLKIFSSQCDEIIDSTINQFKSIIKKHNIQQKDIAESIGVTQQAVSNMIMYNFYKNEFRLKNSVMWELCNRILEDAK